MDPIFPELTTKPRVCDAPSEGTAYSGISAVAHGGKSATSALGVTDRDRHAETRLKGLCEADLDNLETDFNRHDPLLVDPHLNSYSQTREPLFNPFQNFKGICHNIGGVTLLSSSIIQEALVTPFVHADPRQLPPTDTYIPHNRRHELSPSRSYGLSISSPIFASLQIFETALFRPWDDYIIDDAALPEGERRDLDGMYKEPVARQHDNALGCFMAWLYPDNPLVRDLDNVVYAYLVRFKANGIQANRRAGCLIPAFAARMPLLRARFVRARRFHREWYNEWCRVKERQAEGTVGAQQANVPRPRARRALTYDDDSGDDAPPAPRKKVRDRRSRVRRSSSSARKVRFARTESSDSSPAPTPPPRPRRKRRKRVPILDELSESDVGDASSADIAAKAIVLEDSDWEPPIVQRDERGNAL